MTSPTRLPITGASKHQMYRIIANTAQGDFILNKWFGKDCPSLVKTLRQIEAKGSIDLAYWTPAKYNRKG